MGARPECSSASGAPLPHTQPPSLGIGGTLGSYRVVARLGAGRLGELYEAEEGERGRRVAIEILGAGLGEEMLARMREQHRARALLDHPHLMALGPLGQANGIAYLVMEFLHGESLAAVIDRQGRLPKTHGIDLLLPVIAALSELHRAELTHDALRLEDVFVVRTAQGTVVPKIRGLGLECVLNPALAPADPLADQHAAAAILYEILTGALPHDKRRHREPIPASVPLPSIDPELSEVIMRALAAQPQSRFATIEAFGRALSAFASPRGRAAYAALLGIEPDALASRTASPSPAPSAETDARSDLRRRPRALDASAAATPIQGIALPAPPREDVTQEGPRASRLSTPMIPLARSTPPSPAVQDGLITAVALVALVLVMLVVGIAISPPRASVRTHTATAPTATAPTATAPTATAPTSIGPAGAPASEVRAPGPVTIRAVPSIALIELDGVPVGVGHYEGDAPSDGPRRLVTVSAEGFVRRQFFLVGPLDREVVLSPLEPPP